MCAQDDWTVVSSTENHRASNTHTHQEEVSPGASCGCGFGGFVTTGEEEFLSPHAWKGAASKIFKGQSYFSL